MLFNELTNLEQRIRSVGNPADDVETMLVELTAIADTLEGLRFRVRLLEECIQAPDEPVDETLETDAGELIGNQNSSAETAKIASGKRLRGRDTPE